MVLVGGAIGCSNLGENVPAEADVLDPRAASEPATVLFTGREHGISDLYLRRADGAITNLTNDKYEDNWGAWSPTGSAIAFQTLRRGNTEIYVVSADGSDPRNVSNDGAYDGLPVWSPDGSEIAFFSSRGFDPSETGLPGHIYVMASDGTQLRRVTTIPLKDRTGPASWSPDGGSIFFSRLDDESRATFVRLDLKTGSEVVVHEFDGYAGSPRVSPGGDALATSVGGRIALLELPGPLKYVSPPHSHHYHPRWSADGERLIYSARAADGKTFQLQVVDLRTGRVEQLGGNMPENALAASWRPSSPGQRIGEVDGLDVGSWAIDVAAAADSATRSFEFAQRTLDYMGALSHLSPDFYMYSDGVRVSRGEIASAIRDSFEDLRFLEPGFEGVRVVALGTDVALVTFSFLDSMVTKQGEVTRSSGATTLVWVRRGSEWLIKYAHADHQPIAATGAR